MYPLIESLEYLNVITSAQENKIMGNTLIRITLMRISNILFGNSIKLMAISLESHFDKIRPHEQQKLD